MIDQTNQENDILLEPTGKVLYWISMVFFFFFFSNEKCLFNEKHISGRQEEPTILISRLLLRMRRMYAASIRLDFQ